MHTTSEFKTEKTIVQLEGTKLEKRSSYCDGDNRKKNRTKGKEGKIHEKP
jgi:hypothetical protein